MSVQRLGFLKRGQGAAQVGIIQSSDRLYPLTQGVQIMGMALHQASGELAQLGEMTGALRRLLPQGFDLLSNLLEI
jgi:hypothetical protein